MSYTKPTMNANVISSLATTSAERGLTEEAFKAKFDEMPAALKGYLSNVLTPEMDINEAKTPYKTIANLTYYVATTGNNNNDGLTVGTPFLTIAKAISMIPQIVNHTVTVNVAAGTYAEAVVISGFSGSGRISLLGGTSLATAVNFIINGVAAINNATQILIIGFTGSITDTVFANTACIYIIYQFCVSTSTSGYGFYGEFSKIVTDQCKVSNKSSIAILAGQNADILVTNMDAGSGNSIGLYASQNSRIGKIGTMPQGATMQVMDKGGIISLDWRSDTETLTNKTIVPITGTVLPASTGTMTATMDSPLKTITPTGACTFNATGGSAGQNCSFVVTTSGVTSYILTFGTNFKTVGTLATGTVTAKVFTINFVYNGTNWTETSRTTAM